MELLSLADSGEQLSHRWRDSDLSRHATLSRIVSLYQWHSKLIYPTNFNCAFMSNPSMAGYKCWKQSLMHELHDPRPLQFGGYGHGSLQIGTDIIFGLSLIILEEE